MIRPKEPPVNLAWFQPDASPSIGDLVEVHLTDDTRLYFCKRAVVTNDRFAWRLDSELLPDKLAAYGNGGGLWMESTQPIHVGVRLEMRYALERGYLNFIALFSTVNRIAGIMPIHRSQAMRREVVSDVVYESTLEGITLRSMATT